MIRNITAYLINGEYYLYEGRPNKNTKKKIERYIKENEEAFHKGKISKKFHSYSFIDGWEEEKNKHTKNGGLSWPQ
tara:strand:+ start:82 stop:309 length:228 start_codon:yes stop_codon:yes gene_type:complete